MDRSELEALVGELRAPASHVHRSVVDTEVMHRAADALEVLLRQDMDPSGEEAGAANRERYHFQGIRACVTRLHAMAAGMNDPHAKAILNTAALELGVNKPLPDHQPSASGEGWQPIETAPRDGTDFWAFHDLGKHFQARIIEDGRCHNLSANRWAKPTHWMPLPEAPDAQLADGARP